MPGKPSESHRAVRSDCLVATFHRRCDQARPAARTKGTNTLMGVANSRKAWPHADERRSVKSIYTGQRGESWELCQPPPWVLGATTTILLGVPAAIIRALRSPISWSPFR